MGVEMVKMRKSHGWVGSSGGRQVAVSILSILAIFQKHPICAIAGVDDEKLTFCVMEKMWL